MRTLSLFGAGELRALRVNDASIFSFILKRLQVLLGGSGPSTSQTMSEAIDSLCVVELVPPRWFISRNDSDATAIIERCAATITELKGLLPAHPLCQSDASGHPPVLARCTRLECLWDAFIYAPAVWLGLSQLHTLHDVNLSRVSIAAIAAALPRLHTLTAFRKDAGPWFGNPGPIADNSAAVAGFFVDLLPRLRVFRFRGKWPTAAAESATVNALPLPLPLLEVLEWRELYDENHLAQPTVLRGFLGARPTVLSAPHELIVECLAGRVDGAPGEPATSLLTRVCDLEVLRRSVTAPFDVSAMAQVLLAAPQLRTFGVHTSRETAMHVRGDTSWLTASDAPLAPAFVGLVHPRLRHLRVLLELPPGPPSRDESCASRLRRICFPRLRELKVNDETFFVTSDAD
jgi:hypothetical protein